MLSRLRGGAAVLVAAALALPAAALAQDGKPYVVEGPGRQSCADFAALKAGSDGQRMAAAWLTGYLTAHHRLLPDVFDLSSWQTPTVLLGLVRQYCLAHPEAIVEQGAQELVGYLLPRALREPAEVVALKNAGNMALLYRPVLDAVRQALAAAGHPPGSDDAALVAALTAFQAEKGLPETGLPDQATLARLLN